MLKATHLCPLCLGDNENTFTVINPSLEGTIAY